MRYYSSTAVKTVLSEDLTDVETDITVDSTSGFPGAFPYTLILDKDTANEEIVEVQNTAGMALIVERGIDGTVARPHSAGATVEHGVSALDHRLSRQHEAASTGVHGLEPGSAVVGTDDEQALSNKSLGSDLDADGHTIKNLPDPVDDGDPVALGWLMEQESNAASAAIAAAASAAAAAESEANAAESEGNADDSEELARAWAEKMDGPVIEPDHYSSRWYAQRPPTAVYSPDPPTDDDYPGGLLPGDLWVESDVDTEEFDPTDFESRLEALEPTAGLVVSVAGGGTLTDDDDFYYLTLTESAVLAVEYTGTYVDMDAYAWGGAGGGDGGAIHANYGGGGGFGWARFRLRDTCLSVCVGGGGQSMAANEGPGWAVEGGGGLAGSAGYGGQGGGLSGVFIGYPWEAGRPIVIAGGGGGAGVIGVGTQPGGGGGGLVGGDSGAGGGTGGTQTAPGITSSSTWDGHGMGGSLPAGRYRGGSSFVNPDNGGAGAGGGGWYGGGSGDNEPHNSGGGGGSGFLSPEALDGELITATDQNAANNTHDLYVSGRGVGGYTTTDGTGGAVVLRWAKAA